MGSYCLKLKLPTMLEDSGDLSFELPLKVASSEIFDWLSAIPGLIQIFTYPSRQTVTTDSLVNIKPERGSTCTRCATTGESFGTSRVLGVG